MPNLCRELPKEQIKILNFSLNNNTEVQPVKSIKSLKFYPFNDSIDDHEFNNNTEMLRRSKS